MDYFYFCFVFMFRHINYFQYHIVAIIRAQCKIWENKCHFYDFKLHHFYMSPGNTYATESKNMVEV